MESESFFLPTQRRSSRKTIIAAIAGLALVGTLLFVAFNAESTSLNGTAFFQLETPEEQKAYEEFLVKFKKSYLSPEEKKARGEVFTKNYRIIKKNNQDKKSTITLEVNRYADMTLEEFKETKLGYSRVEKNSISTVRSATPGFAGPKEVDHEFRLTGVKNQASCGSCWAFSAVGALEGWYHVQTGETIVLSEQELVDCSTSYGNAGCNGGLMTLAFDYIIEHGLVGEKEYPYKGVDQRCSRKGDSAVTLKSYTQVKANDNLALQEASIEQPISVAVNAGSAGWQFYRSGILSKNCGTNLDHGVTLIGYGTEKGTDFWRVRNSWGTSWGEDGHIRILRESKSTPGVCGIAMDACYPDL